jgi:hypothetical protein
MPIIALTLVLQIILGIHVVRTKRPLYWLFIILVFPLLGGLIYLAAEVVPEWLSGRRGRAALSTVKQLADPGKELREAEAAYSQLATVANAMRFADHLMERGDPLRARDILEAAANGLHADDPALLFRIAVAQLQAKDPAAALKTLAHLKTTQAPHWPVEAEMLYQQALNVDRTSS